MKRISVFLVLIVMSLFFFSSTGYAVKGSAKSSAGGDKGSIEKFSKMIEKNPKDGMAFFLGEKLSTSWEILLGLLRIFQNRLR